VENAKAKAEKEELRDYGNRALCDLLVVIDGVIVVSIDFVLVELGLAFVTYGWFYERE